MGLFIGTINQQSFHGEVAVRSHRAVVPVASKSELSVWQVDGHPTAGPKKILTLPKRSSNVASW